MALFKILKGSSTRISTAVTPFHDGFAYFTPDDGGFYIDSEDNGEKRRIRVSGEVKSIASTLTAGNWINKQQTITVGEIKADQNGIISTSQAITNDQLEAVKNADISVSSQNEGSLTLTAKGEVPACDIPVVILLFS